MIYLITYEDIKNNKDIKTYIKYADKALEGIGYTEHSFAHVTTVSDRAAFILSSLGYSDRTIELCRIAAYMHDIGNVISRVDHSQSGAMMAYRILNELGMDTEEIATIITVIGNHDEGFGQPVDAISAAIIIADKSDVRRSRVRNIEKDKLDTYLDYNVFDGDDNLSTINLHYFDEKANNMLFGSSREESLARISAYTNIEDLSTKLIDPNLQKIYGLNQNVSVIIDDS